ESDTDAALNILKKHGENAWVIGDIAAKDGEEQVEINA
ncbi:MAG: phosphoribosylformylglycinamidine cyclo-ligase, partial [Pseudomonadota bacterium]|nr:phosphoribosylformylglycinamidine cyclo-ligase [Pseudomonadota bacterium]